MTYVLSFDGTDQAECRAEGHFDRMAARSSVGMDVPEGPLSRFADAVVAWMEAQP